MNLHQAKTHLSRLVQQVECGEEVLISRAGRPVARLVPVAGKKPRQLGLDRGHFEVPDDFDAPLPDEILSSFEG